jgi:peptidoglycan/LPS O-acetylase OafA/YrhL
MLLCLPLVALVLHLTDESLPRGVLGDAIASATWVANWRFIFTHQTYADLFAMPSPFQHFWSLAVEEQFYVVFPLLFLLVVGRQLRRGRLAVVLGGLVVLSTLQAAHLQAAGGGLSRAYYGTDARGAELLVGALLALALVVPTGLRDVPVVVRRCLDGAGVLGLVGLGAAFALIAKGDALLYRGGFLAIAVASAAVIAAAVQPGSVVGRLLSLSPAVELGKISYGVYLFHWPIFLLLTKHFTGYDGARLLLLRLVVTLLVAYGSYVVFEQPIRHGDVPVVPGLASWAFAATAGVVAIALATGQLTLPAPPATTTVAGGQLPGASVAASPLTGAHSAAAGRGRTQAAQRATRPGAAQGGYVLGSAPVRPALPRVHKKASVPTELVEDPSKFPVPPVPQAQPGQLKIAVVGDSLGFNLGRGFLSWARERTDVVGYNLAIPGCPLSRGGDRRITADMAFPIDPICHWWDDPSNDRRQALEKFAPDVIVVEDGINEVFDRKLPSWSSWQHSGEPQFDSWLNSELSSAVQQWTSGGAKVLLTNTPCGDWQRYTQFSGMADAPIRVRTLNFNTYDTLSGVQHADLFNRICPGGQYTDTVEGQEDGRPDGFHFSPEAGAALVRNWLGPLAIQTASSRVPPLLR